MILNVDEFSTKIKNGKSFLYCVKKLRSSYGEEYIQFLIEKENFQPVLPVYSSLRNAFIEVDDLSEIQKVISEDIKYKEIIDSFFNDLHENSRLQAEKTLLRAFQ